MIGRVEFAKQGVRRVARLDEDGSWWVVPPLADPAHAAQLDAIAARYAGPSDGPFGPAQLHEAAAYLRLVGFEITSTHVEPREPMPPGTVY